jgi:hypothetical protein
MSEADPERRRPWIETAIVWFVWGTDGLDRGKALPDALVKIVSVALCLFSTVLAVWVRQLLD